MLNDATYILSIALVIVKYINAVNPIVAIVFMILLNVLALIFSYSLI